MSTSATRRSAKPLSCAWIRSASIKPFFPEGAEDEWFSSMFPQHTYRHQHEKSPGCNWVYRSAYIRSLTAG